MRPEDAPFFTQTLRHGCFTQTLFLFLKYSWTFHENVIVFTITHYVRGFMEVFVNEKRQG